MAFDVKGFRDAYQAELNGQSEEDIPTSSFMDESDYENALMQVRNASPEDDVTEALDRLRGERNWYTAFEGRIASEIDSRDATIATLRSENSKLLINAQSIKAEQKEDILEDNEPKTFNDLWKEREG